MVVVQIQNLEQQVADKKRTANDLCRLLDVAPMFHDVDSATTGASTRPDEFYGRPMPDVIRAILEKRKRANQGAATVAEIYDAMEKGGFNFQATKPEYAKRGIYGILGGDETFHKLPGGEYGLLEWYPAAKPRREEGASKPKPRLKPKKAQPKAQSAARSGRISRPAKATQPSREANGPLVGPTEAVWQFVREHPGLDRATVIEKMLARPFATKATDREQLLTSIVRQMVKQNRLRLDGEKVYVIERIAA
jgi:hypothetical protein